MDTKHINIMTSSDNNLAKYILPQLASIARNLSGYHVDFYLFHNQMSSENIKLISQYTETLANISFNEIVIEDIEPYKKLARYGGGWAYEAYFSLCCDSYLPESVERILYIDAGDVIIDGDIAEYYFDDFNGCSLIATIARFVARSGNLEAFNRDDMSNIENLSGILRGIINSGSYVINVIQFRENQMTINDYLYLSDVLCKRFPNEQKVYFGDQGLISAAFVGDIKYFAYPEVKNLWYMPYNFCMWFFDRQSELGYTPKILHYAGVNFKPWQARFSVDELKKYDFQTDFQNVYAPFYMKYKQIEFFEIWWDYCKMTPIYEETNKIASVYASALEKHFLPLCKKHNELVNDNIILQQKLQEQRPEFCNGQHGPDVKKKRKNKK